MSKETRTTSEPVHSARIPLEHFVALCAPINDSRSSRSRIEGADEADGVRFVTRSVMNTGERFPILAGDLIVDTMTADESGIPVPSTEVIPVVVRTSEHRPKGVRARLAELSTRGHVRLDFYTAPVVEPQVEQFPVINPPYLSDKFNTSTVAQLAQ